MEGSEERVVRGLIGFTNRGTETYTTKKMDLQEREDVRWVDRLLKDPIEGE